MSWLYIAFCSPTNCTPYPYLLALLSLFEWFNCIITSFQWLLLFLIDFGVSLALSWSYYTLPLWCYSLVCLVSFPSFLSFPLFLLYELFINMYALFVIHLINT
jgi:hypothetical protein